MTKKEMIEYLKNEKLDFDENKTAKEIREIYEEYESVKELNYELLTNVELENEANKNKKTKYSGIVQHGSSWVTPDGKKFTNVVNAAEHNYTLKEV